MKKFFLFMLVSSILFSCRKDEEVPSQTVPELSAQGAYIVNEGNFLSNNATISFMNDSFAISADPYLAANGVGLGDVLTSFLNTDGKGYAVLNNNNKVEVFNLSNWLNVATIAGVSYPRHIVKANNGKLYLSGGNFTGTVYVINGSTNTVESTISVGNGPERMQVLSDKLYVCNSGGWLEDNSVSVIDLNSNTVISTVQVGDRPVDIEIDNDGQLWVMCMGKTVYNEDFSAIIEETPSRLVKIDPSTNLVIWSEQIGEVGDHASVLEFNSNTNQLMYVNDGVYSLSVNEPTLPGDLFVNGDYASVDVRDNGEVWLTSKSNFINNSILYQYSPQGGLIEQHAGGMGTNAVVFF